VAQESDQTIVDLEEFTKAGKPVPGGRQYRIRIDKTQYVVDHQFVTGRELLSLAGKVPVEKFRVFQHLHGGQAVPIALDERVDLAKPGIERFKTLPVDQTEGDGQTTARRRQFRLPEIDEEFLGRLGCDWETITEGESKRLVIYGFEVPSGYSRANVDLNLRLEPLYPTTQIDMVYFHPPLTLTSGRTIGALAEDKFDGKTWQRWSRHRTEANPWRAGEDGVETHLECVRAWLQRELAK
jgi:hypothetical protein